MSRVGVITWDWREQPDLEAFSRLVAEVSGGVLYGQGVDTGSDEYAFVLSTVPLAKKTADEVFSWWSAGCGEAGDRLDTFDWPAGSSSGAAT